MVTDEEKREIINEAVQEALLKLPDVIGNLMVNHAALAEMNAKFYSDYPELKNHKDVVTSVVEAVESENPNLEYEDILKKSVPEIKKRLETVDSLDVKKISEPNRNDKYVDLGEI